MGCRGGGSIYYGIIYWPPPLPTNIQERFFVDGIQWQLSFNTQNIYISQTILIHGWHFFLMGCGGGGGSIYYCIIYWPPPSNKYSRIFFVNGIQWQLSFNTQNIYISQTILIHGWHFFLMGCGGGGSIYYCIIYWPPPLQQIFKNFFL